MAQTAVQSAMVRGDAPAQSPAPTAMAYLLDGDSEGVVRSCFADLGITGAELVRGNLDTAIGDLTRRGWPRFLFVDVSGISDPLMDINRLAEICDPTTEVFVVGDRNDIVLYRDLKNVGVAEYYFKPLIGSVVTRGIADVAEGKPSARGARSGKLILVLGARGGVGGTTIAANAAWHMAEARERRVLLLDLDLQFGDAALQLDARPTHALEEALEHPERTDNLFLERGVANVTPRLGLLAGLEPLGQRVAPPEEAVLALLHKLLAQYRYVFVDLPGAAALTYPQLLHMPGVVLLVSDGGLSGARDCARWREILGPSTPERTVLHLLNRQDAPGALPSEQLLRVIGHEPDIALAYDQGIMAAAALGIAAMQKCPSLAQAVAKITGQLVGVAVEDRRSLWKRIFS